MQEETMVKIWDGNVRGSDRYVVFKGEFAAAGKEKTMLTIACDNVFTCRINGELVAFGACQNYPGKYPYQYFDVSESARSGGVLEITVWHQGVESATVMDDDAFLAFKLTSGDVTLLESNKDILCAEHTGYVGGSQRWITCQLGCGYVYDFKNEGQERFASAIEYGNVTAYPWELCRDGKADLKLLAAAPADLQKTTYGYQADLGRETVGYLTVEIEAQQDTEVVVTYGEHLQEGRVPASIGGREFSLLLRCKKGKNTFSGLFRRLAGRYLETIGEGITVHTLTLLPVERDVKIKKRTFDDARTQAIYDVCVRTLVCSMHDHYEDCPWREQALYALDSRNQMLCGYYAFEDYAFQRENIRLMAKGLYGHGLLALTFPCQESKPIPFFSLVYPILVAEYIEYSGDRTILDEVGGVIETIMKTFGDKIENNHLIADLPYPCWNFYEWTDGSANDHELRRAEHDPFEKQFDCILNCAYVLSRKACDRLFGVTSDCSNIVSAIKDTFFDADRGVFVLSTKDKNSSVLVNAMAILAGAGDKKIAEKITSKEHGLIPVTLSMNTFFYDALLTFGTEYHDYILADIREKYGYMLDCGATTFWETLLGAEDFGGAGSLCHGWSAVPVYYLCKLTGKQA